MNLPQNQFQRNIIWLAFLCFHCVYTLSADSVVELEPGNKWEERGNGQKLHVYCHQSANKSLIYFWRSVFLELTKAPSHYTFFDGGDLEAVVQQHNEHTSTWLPTLPWQHSVLSLPAFNRHCLGVVAQGHYELQLSVRSINFWKVLQTAIGILLFFGAPTLSRNSFFHYTTGVSFGIIASVLVLVFLLSKLIPKKPAAYSMLLFGVSVVLYGLQILFSNVQEIVVNYSNAVLIYITVSAFASFLICYRFGPVTNVRTLNLIQWTMQLVGMLLIFFSSEYREASTALVLVIIIAYAIPASWVVKMKCLWCYYFPPKVKLLTEMEYIEQGNVETKKALENLRSYCRSPDCDAWKTVRRLNNPHRFAKFISGESHLNDEEILEYDADAPFPDGILHQESDDDNSDEDIHSRPTANHNRYSHR